jgi:hypothetical protein
MFMDVALDSMGAIAARLGDDLINERPDLDGANSPYVIGFHSVQVCHWWVGCMCAGRDVNRNRPAEFTASGSVADLLGHIAAGKAQLHADFEMVEPQAPLQRPDLLPEGASARSWTQAMALVHTYEELAQHLGQLEITRDILLAG